ncbi:DUF6746 family protein [Thauera sp.]|uniref:DUF6746 family protein n=1 Tax=Thauera sp. TaxID=1905334 RepID=UPI0039E5AD22
MIKQSFAILALAAFGTLGSLPLHAEDSAPRVNHYEAKKGESKEETIAILRETNAKLKELLDGEMGEYDIHDVHSLCYTLEDALLALGGDEAKRLHKIVTDMHFSSEGLDRDAVIDYGRAYLSGIEKLIH